MVASEGVAKRQATAASGNGPAMDSGQIPESPSSPIFSQAGKEGREKRALRLFAQLTDEEADAFLNRLEKAVACEPSRQVEP